MTKFRIQPVRRRDGSRAASTDKRKPIGGWSGASKTVSIKRIDKMCRIPGATVCQPNCYEHIIRDEAELDHIREYIAADPVRWGEDRENLHAKIREQ